jgi:hypothetical protein
MHGAADRRRMIVDILIVVVLSVQTVTIVGLMWAVWTLARRHMALGRETTRMLALHQDYLAAFDARLRALP